MTYRWRAIAAELDSMGVSWTPGRRPYGSKLDERIVEYPWVLSRLPASAKSVFDAGGALNHRPILASKWLRNREVTVCTLAPEENNFVAEGVSYQFADLRRLPFKSESFDVVISISTLEHVGMDNDVLYGVGEAFQEKAPTDYLIALREVWRLVTRGGTLLATVPYGLPRDHGWFQVLGRDAVEQMRELEDLSSGSVEIYAYREGSWCLSDLESERAAEYYDVHAEKQPAQDGAAASRAIACLHLTKSP